MSADGPAQSVVFETGHNEMIHDAQLDYYGKRLATASSDKTIRIFEVEGDKQTLSATIAGHSGPVWQVAWAHPKFGNILASCGYDNKIIVWKEQSAGQWVQLWDDDRHEASVNSVAWAPHSFGLILAAGSADGNVSVWTHKQDNTWERYIFLAHKNGTTSVSWAPDLKAGSLLKTHPNSNNPAMFASKRLVTGGCDNAVRIWRYDDSQQQQAMAQGQDPSLYPAQWVMDKEFVDSNAFHKDWVRDVSWAPGIGLPSSTIASCGEDKKVIVWMEDEKGNWKTATIDFAHKVWRVSWSLMGNLLAVSQGDNKVSLWKESTDGEWKEVRSVEEEK